MSSKKAIAAITVLLMLSVAAFAPLSTTSDAEDVELMEGIDIDIGDVDTSSIQESLEELVEILRYIRGTAMEIDFTNESADNTQQIHDLLRDSADALELEITEEDIERVTNYFGVIPVNLLTSTLFEPENEIQISEGSLKLGVEIPEFLIELLTNGDAETEVSGLAELGIILDVHSDIDLRAEDDIVRTGMFGSGFITAFDNAAGPISKVLKNLIVSDNIDVLKNRPVSIAKDSVYSDHTDTNLAMYISFDTDTNVNDTSSDSQYMLFNVGLHIRGTIDNKMELISGNGPQSIDSSMDFNSMDVEFAIGVSNLNEDVRELMFGIKRVSMDLKYTSDVDGAEETCTIKNSGVLSVAHGVSIAMQATDDAPITVQKPKYKETSEERSPTMNAIILEAKEQSVSESSFDPTNQYMVGGALAAIALAIIIGIRFVKKY